MDPDNPYQTRLKELLGPTPTTPWAALIPQLLLWSFRRFCKEKLILISDILLIEQVWEDFFELIHNYAPQGLQNVGSTWLAPEHIYGLHSSLEEYNAFFYDILESLDLALAEESDGAQTQITLFLDDQLRDTMLDWLGAENPLLIFPLSPEEDRRFSDGRFLGLIRYIMRSSQHLAEEEDLKSQTTGGASEEEEEDLEAEAKVDGAPTIPNSVAEAFSTARRRMTRRRRGPRANRGSTLRSKRLRRHTRRSSTNPHPNYPYQALTIGPVL